MPTPYERVLTTTVDNIEHIESESLYGISVVKIFLQPKRIGYLGLSSGSKTAADGRNAAVGPQLQRHQRSRAQRRVDRSIRATMA